MAATKLEVTTHHIGLLILCPQLQGLAPTCSLPVPTCLDPPYRQIPHLEQITVSHTGGTQDAFLTPIARQSRGTFDFAFGLFAGRVRKENAMPPQERDVRRHESAPVEPKPQTTSTQRTTPQQALWSCLVAVVVVFILGILFYGINAVDHPQTATAPAIPSVSNKAASGRNDSASTTGQGGPRASKQPARDRAQ
jgi:hypothetical protein